MTTATMDERTAKKAAKERESKLKAAQTLLKKRKLREWVLASTLNFSRFVGVNPYDFGHAKVKFDEETGFYPWCPYAERAAAYFDKPGANAEGMAIAKPKYPVFVGRDHFKTTIAECALALCFDQEAIDVTAEPGLACPTITVPALARLEFGEIEEHHRPAEGSILSP